MSAEVVPVPESRSYGEQVAEEVRAAAARKQVTNARLAAALHVSHASMSRRMTGRYPFTVDELAAVASTLGVSVASLLPTQRTAAPVRDGGPGVAGAGFEPATSGSRAGLADVLDFPYDGRASQGKGRARMEARRPEVNFTTAWQRSHGGTKTA